MTSALSIVDEFEPKRKEAEDWHREAREYFDDAVAALAQRIPQFQEESAFYRGLQWGTVTPIGWYQDEWDLDEQREVYNMCRPTIRTAVADKLRNVPNPNCAPSSDDRMAYARAQASKRLLRSVLRNGILPFDVLQRCETAVDMHGIGWYKTVWDPYLGRRVDGRPEGEISVQFVDPISAPCDPVATCESEISYVCHRKLVAERVLWDRFPRDFFGKSTEGRWKRDDYSTDNGLETKERIENDGRAMDLMNRAFGQARAKGNQLADFIEYWEKPSNAHPFGRLVVFCGQVLIYAGPIPYHDAENECVWPWIQRLGDNLMPNGLFADGVLRDIIPPQRTINHNASKRKEWVDKVLSPPLLNPIGSGIEAGMFSDVAGAIIPVNPGHMPQWMRVPDVPSALFSQEGATVSVMQTISGFSEISRGQPVPGVESGRGMAILYEFQQGSREPSVMRFKLDIGRAYQNVLRLMKLYYPEGRITRQIGQSNRLVAVAFRRGEYDLDAEVVVDAFSGLPHSRATRFAERLDLFAAGAYEQTPAAQAFRKAVGYDADDAEAFEPEEAHRRRARDEQVSIMMDPLARLEALPQDNHEIHLDEHDLFSISEEYFALPAVSRQQIDSHRAHHEQILLEQQHGYAAQEQTLGGGSLPKGPPAPPPPPPPQQEPEPPGVESPADGGHSTYPEEALQAANEAHADADARLGQQ